MTTREMARILGRRGGRRRARRLSAEERRRIASMRARARALSIQMARRIEDNLRYAAVVDELRRPTRPVRHRAPTDRLPGIYPDEP